MISMNESNGDDDGFNEFQSRPNGQQEKLWVKEQRASHRDRLWSRHFNEV
jgi:hypothetical protein